MVMFSTLSDKKNEGQNWQIEEVRREKIRVKNGEMKSLGRAKGGYLG